jgi:GR25 family glycosyltransferase involved in LPS biosynthesis
MWVFFLLLGVIFLLYKINKKSLDYKCFLLTIPSSKDRKDNFEANHDPTVPLEIIYGVDTKNVEIAEKFKHIIEPMYFTEAMKMHYNNKNERPDLTYFNLGAIGCYMGHMEFYKRCFNQGLKYAVVFEDNVIVLNHKLYDEIQDVINTMRDDFEICFFHCIARYLDEEVDTHQELERVKWISSTKCYLVHIENMRKYHKHFFPIDNHIDMKHEDLIAQGARVFYKDLSDFMQIDKNVVSTIGHSGHRKPKYFSRQYPSITTDVLQYGY